MQLREKVARALAQYRGDPFDDMAESEQRYTLGEADTVLAIAEIAEALQAAPADR